MKNSKLSRPIKIFSTLSITLIIGVIIYTLFVNNSIKNVVEMRDMRLDIYEYTKLWVVEDVRDYVLIKNKETYTNAKDSVHMNNETLNDLFGSEYDSSRHVGYSKVSFVDAQYTLERDGRVIYYLTANVSKSGETKEINFMVFVSDNLIYDIIAF